MKLLKLIPGAAIALTVLIPLKANAYYPPNGWSQVGKKCNDGTDSFIKLQKYSDNSKYGVSNYTKEKWVIKDVTLKQANKKMNDTCGGDSYQPT